MTVVEYVYWGPNDEVAAVFALDHDGNIVFIDTLHVHPAFDRYKTRIVVHRVGPIKGAMKPDTEIFRACYLAHDGPIVHDSAFDEALYYAGMECGIVPHPALARAASLLGFEAYWPCCLLGIGDWTLVEAVPIGQDMVMATVKVEDRWCGVISGPMSPEDVGLAFRFMNRFPWDVERDFFVSALWNEREEKYQVTARRFDAEFVFRADSVKEALSILKPWVVKVFGPHLFSGMHLDE